MEKISLIIPLKDEEESIQVLIDSIAGQTVLPDEVIFIDGGSTDKTKPIIKRNMDKTPLKIRLIETQKAFPGQARNIGIEESLNELVAFSDGGIELARGWLEELIRPMKEDASLDVVYGAYEPRIDSFIRECSLMAYVPPKEKVEGLVFRTNFIASSLFKKSICKAVGGFPPFRAGEDKIFMDKVKKSSGAKIYYTPRAMVYWQIPGTIKGIFKRFCEFSEHDILAGRARDWHYSVFRTYGVIFIFCLLGVFISALFLWGILALWIMRFFKSLSKRRKDFKLRFLLNPKYSLTIMLIIFITDLALFCGSIKYLRTHYAANK